MKEATTHAAKAIDAALRVRGFTREEVYGEAENREVELSEQDLEQVANALFDDTELANAQSIALARAFDSLA